MSNGVHAAFDIGRARRAALGILACALTALVYRSAVDLPFVFDDRTTVVLNPLLGDPWDLRAVLLGGLSRSAVNLSYALDRALWGVTAFGFHVSNFVLHIIVVGLFYGWCTRALADGVRPGSERGQSRARAGSGRGRRGVRPRSGPGLTPVVEWPAFFAAATFGLHPVIGTTALYVSARSEMLCAAAFLIALIFARRAILVSRTGPAALAVAFSLVAAACSPASAALPIVMLAYDRLVIRSKGWERRLWRVYVPVIAVVGVASAWRLYAAMAIAPVPSRSVLDNLLTQSIVIWRYAGLLVVPVGQAIVHDVHWVASPADPLALLAFVALAGAVAGAVSLRRTAPLASVGAIWFVAALAPTSSFVALRDPMAEPRLYVAGAGLIFAAVSVLVPLLATRRMVQVLATAALAMLGFAASTRARIWQDPLILWTEAVQRAPGSWQAHFELAEALEEIGACDRAAREHALAVQLNSVLGEQRREAWRPSCSQGRVQR